MTLPNNIILSNAIRTLTNVSFIINGMPETEAEIAENVKWIVGEDSAERAIYGDNSEVTWSQIKTKYDELKAANS